MNVALPRALDSISISIIGFDLCRIYANTLWVKPVERRSAGRYLFNGFVPSLSSSCRRSLHLLVDASHKVYQVVAQKNAQINIALLENSAMIAKAGKDDSAVMRQIAIETKKDNASMKTIAVLGMVFLPGTFVAVG
jgi:hypothetical protein